MVDWASGSPGGSRKTLARVDKFQVPKYKRYQYERSPIQEAVIEVKFLVGDSFDSTIPGRFFDKVQSKFPMKNDLEFITLTIGATGLQGKRGSERPAQVPKVQTWSPSRDRLLQVGPGLLTANCVKYTNWEAFLADFVFCLKAYTAVQEFSIPQRIGVRYINRFVFDAPEVTLSDFFRFGLSVPEPLEGASTFESVFEKDSFQIPLVADFKLRVRFGTDAKRIGETGLPFILDIDCFTLQFDGSEPAKNMIAIAEAAHEVVEFTFESFLTDKTRKVLGGLPL